MKLWILGKLDTLAHWIIPGWVPFPLWAYRICTAYEEEFERRESEAA